MNKGLRAKTRRTLRMLSMRFTDGGAAAASSASAATSTGYAGSSTATAQSASAQASSAASTNATPPAAGQEGQTEKTFTRDELNRAVAAEKAKAIESYKAQMEQEKAEAERLAKMNADEKLAHAQQQAQEALAELNAYKLKAEAQRIAAEAGLPASFLEPVDFRTAKAEEVSALIDKMAKDYKASVEAALNEKLKQSPPQTHTNTAVPPKTLKDAIAAAMQK